MHVYIIIIIILLFYYVIRIRYIYTATPFQINKEKGGGSGNGGYKYGVKKNSFADTLITGLKGKPDIVYYGKTNDELLKKLSKHELDSIIIISEENEYKDKLQIVNTLGPAVIHILCNNGYRILDLADIVKPNNTHKYKINIEAYGSIHQQTCTLILNYLNITDDWYTYTTEPYADIYFFIDSIPSLPIKNITAREPLHFLNISKLNNGEIYQYTSTEQHFYKTNPNFEKALLYNKDLFDVYPRITIPNENDIFVKTIQTHYIFLTNISNNVHKLNNIMISDKIKKMLKNKSSIFYTNPAYVSMREVTPESLNKNNLKYNVM